MSSSDLEKLSKKELIQIIDSLKPKNCTDLLEYTIDYRSLLEASSDIIVYIDKEGNIRYINSSWKEYYPSFRDIKIGGHFRKNIPSNEIDRAIYVFDQVINKGINFHNEMMRTVDEKGDVVYFTATISPVRDDDGSIIGGFVILKNVTDQHQMEKRLKKQTKALEEYIRDQARQSEELKELRDLNEDIINYAPIGILMLDPNGIAITENNTLRKIMSRSASQSVVGVNLLDYWKHSNSDIGKLFEQCLRDKRMVKVSQVSYSPISGSEEIIINITGVPILDKTMSVEKVLVMVEDFTEQSKMMRRAQKAEKNSALGFLASGVASELRNHMNNMVMDINFIGKNINRDSPALQYVETLQHELGRIKGIAEQLVSLAGADEDEKDILELNKVIQQHSIEVMINRLKKDGFTVNIETARDNPTVRATWNQLQQLLVQFLENAEEAMPQKGVISIAVASMMTPSGKFASLTVSDSGIGIPEENINAIFQPFFTTKGKEATGLGLMIISAIVDNLGGTIAVKSRPGQGTTIRVLLPAAVRL
jgi:PAS domain S-box-containing protein